MCALRTAEHTLSARIYVYTYIPARSSAVSVSVSQAEMALIASLCPGVRGADGYSALSHTASSAVGDAFDVNIL